MKKDILLKKFESYRKWLNQNRDEYNEVSFERAEVNRQLQSIITPQTTNLALDELSHLLQPLWSMKMFRYNIAYQSNFIVNKNAGISIGRELSNLLYGNARIEERWDDFRSKVKGIGATAMSELLARCCPDTFMPWNPKAHEAFQQLGIQDLPKRDRIDGATYAKLCKTARQMVEIAKQNGYEEIKDLLYLNSFFWEDGIFNNKTPQVNNGGKQKPAPTISTAKSPETKLSPYEVLETTSKTINDNFRQQLKDRIQNMSWQSFEKLTLHIVNKVTGVSGNFETTAEHTPYSGDGGIDGVIKDKFGYVKMCIQAKKWSRPVGAEVVQTITGAAFINKAEKSVLITTSSFTKRAREDAEKAQNLKLIDGDQLVELMISSKIGITYKTYTVPLIDEDFMENFK